MHWKTKKCDYCIKLCRTVWKQFKLLCRNHRLEAIQIIGGVLKIFKKNRKLLAAKISLKIEGINSLLKLNEELFAIGITVSETKFLDAILFFTNFINFS